MGGWPPNVNGVRLPQLQLLLRPTWPRQLVVCFLYALLICLSASSAFAYGNNVPKFFTHLKTMQKSVCDGDMLHVKCPRNTSITFNTVFYGRNASYGRMCPSTGRSSAPQGSDDTTCIWKGALPLLVEACKNQQECKVNPQREFRQRDPCPHIKKATDVSYQCRPNLFLHKTVCHGEKMLLKCQGKQRRLLIFSAYFGATKLGVTECHQQDDIAKECSAPGATDTVLTECQGRRRCQLIASQERFGRIFCVKQAAIFLRVVYTCVSREILKEYDNDDEDFTTDDYTVSPLPSSTAAAAAAAAVPPVPTTSLPKSVNDVSTAIGASAPPAAALPPPSPPSPAPSPPPPPPPQQQQLPGVEEPAGEKTPLNRSGTSIIYTVPIPGSAGDSVKLREVIDGSANNGHLRSSMSTSNRGDGPPAPPNPGLLGMIELLSSIKSVPKNQMVMFAVGAGVCVCLVFSMVCLIGSLQKGKRKKQQRKKLVVLTPNEFDDMGEASDTLSMGHIAPPTLTSTLHRASQGSLLGGTLSRSGQSAALHVTGPGSNPGTIRRIPSDTHPRAPQGSFYYS